MKNIEFLRIILTLQIIWCHFGGTLGIWNACHLAVQGFFIISGFFLAATFKPDQDTFIYMKNKLIRFMPLVCFGVALSLIFEKNINGNMLLSDIFLYSGTGLGGIAWGYNPPAWYISVLFWTSLLFFYIMKSLKKEYCNILIGFVSFVSLFFYTNYNDEMIGFVHARFLEAIGIIGVGYFVFHIYEYFKDCSIKNKIIYSILECCVFIFSISSVIVKSFCFGNGKIQLMIAYIFLILMFALKKGYISSFFEKDIFAKIAKYTLAVFLTHWVVAWTCFRFFFSRYKELCIEHLFLTCFIVFFCCIILGVWAHHAIELPATKALKNTNNQN